MNKYAKIAKIVIFFYTAYLLLYGYKFPYLLENHVLFLI